MELFVAFVWKFNLVADSPFDTGSIIILRIKNQGMQSENNDDKKNNPVEESSFICNQSMSISGINEPTENYPKTRETSNSIKA